MSHLISNVECSLDVSRFGVKIFQPERGFRFSSDSVLLGNFVNSHLPNKSQKILDVGSGVGTAVLHAIDGRSFDEVCVLDMNPVLLDICRENFLQNDHTLRESTTANVSKYPLKGKIFDVILTNPPFYDKSEGRVSPTKTNENHENLDIKTWIDFCLKRLKQKGLLFLIHIPAKLPEILKSLGNRAGEIEITPVMTIAENAERVLIKCKKDSATPLVINKPINFFSKFRKL